METVGKIEKAIDLLQAFVDGKDVEAYDKEFDKWFTLRTSTSMFNTIAGAGVDNMRIKSEPEYKPYQSRKEFRNAQKEHGDFLLDNISGTLYLPIMVTDFRIETKEWKMNYDVLLNSLTWEDGTPCGTLITENDKLKAF